MVNIIRDVRFRANLKDEVKKRRDYNQISDIINFDKKTKPGFYDGVNDSSSFKEGLTNQLKDYIEGKISAEQLLKRPEINKSESPRMSKTFNFSRNRNKRNTLAVVNTNITEFEEGARLNYVDLLKDNLKKRMSFVASSGNKNNNK